MNTSNRLDEIMFTSAAVLDLLLQIDELKDHTIGLSETLDGNIQLQIDDSIYMIENNDAKIIPVDDEIIDEIGITTEDTYADIASDIEYDSINIDNDLTSVNSGIIKEIVKSLALGGMIRFASKHLLK